MLESALEIALEAGTDSEGPVRLGFDEVHMTVRAHAKLAERAGDRVELVPAGGLVENLRAVKDEGEVSAIRASTEIADDVYRWLISEHGLAGTHRARGRHRARATGPGPGRRRAFLPRDRRRRRERRSAACHSPPRRRDPPRHAGRGRPRLRARLLLLGLHAHICHRRDRRGGPRVLRAGALRPGGGAGRHPAGRGRAGGRPRGARRDRGRRARRPVRARARARRRPRGS